MRAKGNERYGSEGYPSQENWDPTCEVMDHSRVIVVGTP